MSSTIPSPTNPKQAESVTSIGHSIAHGLPSSVTQSNDASQSREKGIASISTTNKKLNNSQTIKSFQVIPVDSHNDINFGGEGKT